MGEGPIVAVILRGELPDWTTRHCGYSDGYGYGDGRCGHGYGSDLASYWLAAIQGCTTNWTDAQRVRLEEVKKLGATIAFWRSDKDGRAANTLTTKIDRCPHNA